MTDRDTYFDRLSRTWSDVPPSYALSSQYLVAGVVALAQVPVPPLSVLLEDDSAQVAIELDSRQDRVTVEQGGEKSSLRAARQVSAQVQEWWHLGAAWGDILEAVFPVIQISATRELLEVDPLEQMLNQRMAELRHVYLLPARTLHFESERLPVARARRISRRATQVLASRTEDWLKVTASGITPKVVESMVREERIDLYENRVAARLLDSVQRSLRETLRDYEEVDVLLSQHELVGWWRQRNRLAELWGSQPPGDDIRARLQQRRDDLRRLLVALARFRDGPLYRAIPRRARVRQPIHITNLLTDDAHYRAIRDVWKQWWSTRGEQKPAATRREEYLEDAAAFDDYAWLTLAHALNRLPRSNIAEPQSVSTRDIRVSTPWGAISLAETGEPNETAWRLWFEHAGAQRAAAEATVVPLACEVLAGPDAAVRKRLDLLGKAASANGGSTSITIVLYPGTDYDLKQLEDPSASLAHLVGPAAPPGWQARDVWVIPVSPLDLQSLERVERAVRWLVFSTAFSQYPIRAQFPSAAQDLLEACTWIEPLSSQGEVLVHAVPSKQDERSLEHRVQERARQHEMRPRSEGIGEATALRDGLRLLQAAAKDLDCLAVCVVCPDNRGELAPRGSRTFEVTCNGCGTRWGLRRDPGSARAIPYLWIGESGGHIDGYEVRSWLGRDALAEPCVSENAVYGQDVVNPWTGECTASATRREACGRCARLAGA